MTRAYSINILYDAKALGTLDMLNAFSQNYMGHQRENRTECLIWLASYHQIYKQPFKLVARNKITLDNDRFYFSFS
jgi:hypothetical protein